jgi:hypothetical protein
MQTLKDVLIAAGAYIGACFLTAVVFIATNGDGIEANASDALPYLTVMGILLGLVLGNWWLLLLPVLHMYLFEPLRYGGVNVTYEPTQAEYVAHVVGGLGIGLGVRLMAETLLRPKGREPS